MKNPAPVPTSENESNPKSSSKLGLACVSYLKLPLIALAIAPCTAFSAIESSGDAPTQAAPFASFAPRVKLHWDSSFLYIENNGLPTHSMMVGITAWQQQVPMPQSYFGDNAWRVPLHPVPAKESQTIKGHFLRGAIALAANGIPIFNPQNNRGEISQEIGELDQWGGHCGRADDYHYHAAPLHLQAAVGKDKPIAYALDGYPIYGLTEVDGSPLGKLDECNGHTTPTIGYHYHASTKYPYVNGGFHGEVVELGGQVDPQPHAQSVRQALPPLNGAKITGFKAAPDEKSFSLQYTVGNKPASVNYGTSGDGTWKFKYVNADGSTSEETGTMSARGSGGGRPKERNGGGPFKERSGTPDEQGGAPASDRKSPNLMPKVPSSEPQAVSHSQSSGSFKLTSPEVMDGGNLPIDYTGDGSSATLPLAWSGAPAGTKSYALIMHHLDPEGKTKIYWTLYNIPASTQGLSKNTKDVGVLGRNTVNDRLGYAPPHSKGPGAKTYVLTLYALSAPPQITTAPSQVTGESLAAALKDRTLATTELSVVYTRDGTADSQEQGGQKIPRREDRNEGPSSDLPPPRKDGEPKEREGDDASAQDAQPTPWMKKHGSEIDTDGDGVITLAELADDMNRAFAIYDQDKNGVLSPVEVEKTGDVREGAAFAGLIFKHFTDLDSTGDGNVSRDEMVAAVKFIFTSADLNHDNRVTSMEWQNASNAPFQVRSGNPSGPSSSNRSPNQDTAKKPAKEIRPTRNAPDAKGLIKPDLTDTIKVNVYADNWFMLYINGKLVAVDPIDFIPHNVVSVDILPEYPMTIAVMAKDNADPKTGMEYGNHVGDGGLIIKFADGTVSNATWKAKCFFKGPINHDVAHPTVEHTPIPENWYTVNFDDSKWANTAEYTEQRVNPKEAFYQADFTGAKFIWTEDLDLDNTIIFRTKIEKPTWTKRWNTKPDLDVTGAPTR